jgi:hypothetical protein
MEKEKERKLKEKEELKDWYLGEIDKLIDKLDEAETEEECMKIMLEKTKLSVELGEKDPQLKKEMYQVGIEMRNRIYAKIGILQAKNHPISVKFTVMR